MLYHNLVRQALAFKISDYIHLISSLKDLPSTRTSNNELNNKILLFVQV